MSSRLILPGLLLATLCAASVALAAAQQGEGAAAARPATDAFDEASAEYERALDAWKRELRGAKDLRTRRALRKAHPIREHQAVFEGLADAGDGRALLWLLDRVDDAGGSIPARVQRRQGLYQRLIAEHVPGALVPELCERLFRDRQLHRRLGDEAVEGLVQRILGAVTDPAQRASVSYGLARWHFGSSSQERADRGAEMLEELLERHPDASWAAAAEELLFERRHLRVGCVAPDFTGATVDGDPVRLSDHRGEVVVLDFFGFW